ncbi:paraquat-inducible protein A [Salaquimonas pukyongi]|uniref:paraquat-inducible protein A n=1 Tax=Salaquimonas pukyongi TaxID=2712698 RepID=UPI00096B7CBD|nr:paraquat-inducible protein A [Salaquimonas pukyongi]
MMRVRPYLLLAAAIFFGLGISLPLVRFEKLWLFSETPSLLGLVYGLWQEGSLFLAVIVGLFSLCFPVVKMAIAFRAAINGNALPNWAGMLSKWSMMDVLLVAIVIFAAKTSGLATAISQPGIWFYALSAILLAVASFETQSAGGKR